jgi:hypothetical protein
MSGSSIPTTKEPLPAIGAVSNYTLIEEGLEPKEKNELGLAGCCFPNLAVRDFSQGDNDFAVI